MYTRQGRDWSSGYLVYDLWESHVAYDLIVNNSFALHVSITSVLIIHI